MYLPQLVVVEVHLVEEDTGGDMIGFGGDQQSVDEARGGAWKPESGDNAEEVDIGGDDMRLLAELGGATNDIVLAVGHIVDDTGAVVLHFEEDMVTHSHRIRLLVAPQAVIATQTAVKKGYG